MCSQGHPNSKETGSPQAKQYINAYRKKSKEKKRAANNKQNNDQQNEQNRKNKNPSRLSNLDVSELIVENNIKIEIELFAIADEQQKTGKKDLSNFALPRSTKALSDLLENTWKMESASKKVFRSKQTCIEVIHEHFHIGCADSYSEEWLNCVLEVLQDLKNESSIFHYCSPYS